MSWNSPTKVIFPRWVDPAVKVVVALVLLGVGYAHLIVAFGFSPRTLAVGYAPEQPVPYSHALHVGELGLDCRYCHTSVERGAKANIPPTQTCMNCHSKVLVESKKLEPIRESARTGLPVEWVKVHDLADYAYFDHSAHVTRGIGCESCHGRIDTMEVVYQAQPLSMSWCLDCHRNPEKHLRDPKDVTVMGHTPPKGKTQDEYGRELIKASLKTNNPINPPTDCSTCHR